MEDVIQMVSEWQNTSGPGIDSSPDVVDTQKSENEAAAVEAPGAIAQSSEQTQSASAPDMMIEIPIDEVSARNEMDLVGTGMRTLALKCKDMPEVSRETRLLRKAVSDRAKSIMSGLDSSASECQKNLLDILDAGESNLAAGQWRMTRCLGYAMVFQWLLWEVLYI